MVWSHTKPDKAERHRQLLIHVHLGAMDLPHQLLSRVEACRPRADDGHRGTWAIVLGSFFMKVSAKDAVDLQEARIATPCTVGKTWVGVDEHVAATSFPSPSARYVTKHVS